MVGSQHCFATILEGYFPKVSLCNRSIVIILIVMATTTTTTSSLPSSKSRLERAAQIVRAQKARYPDVPMMDSAILFEKQQQQKKKMGKSDKDDFVLVDIRMEEEREVSIIPGSVSLQTFEREIVKDLDKEHTQVIIHCTWAFRSGHVTRCLRNRYQLTNLCHLDGIVLYTHVPGAFLVDKDTGKPVKRVQTISKPAATPAEGYESVYWEGVILKIGWILSYMTYYWQTFKNWVHGVWHGGHLELKKLKED